MTCHSGSTSELYSRYEKAQHGPSFEKNLFPYFTSQDVIEISGEAGSGKTEMLYHFIISCVFPSVWQGIDFGGLETEITFIDNDCHFDLLRLVTIMENRVKSLVQTSNSAIDKTEIFTFVQSTLKFIHIIKCYDSNEFILTLSSLENALCLKRKKNIIMIDGLSSFYLSDRAIFQNNFTKLVSHYRIIINLIINISKRCTPVIATRRKILNMAASDKKVFGQIWNSTTTWRLELKFKASLPNKTLFTVFNIQNSIEKLCSVSNLGFTVLEENKNVIN